MSISILRSDLWAIKCTAQSLFYFKIAITQRVNREQTAQMEFSSGRDLTVISEVGKCHVAKNWQRMAAAFRQNRLCGNVDRRSRCDQRNRTGADDEHGNHQRDAYRRHR